MNWLDIVLIAVAAVSTATGFVRGFTRMAIGCGATVLAVILSLLFYGVAGGFFAGWGLSRSVANFCGFAAVFCGVLLAGAVLAAIVGKLLRLVGLGFADRAAGGLLGLLRGAVFGMIVVMLLMAFSAKPAPDAVRHSRLAPYLMAASNVVANFAPRELRNAYDKSRVLLERAWKEVKREVER